MNRKKEINQDHGVSKQLRNIIEILMSKADEENVLCIVCVLGEAVSGHYLGDLGTRVMSSLAQEIKSLPMMSLGLGP